MIKFWVLYALLNVIYWGFKKWIVKKDFSLYSSLDTDLGKLNIRDKDDRKKSIPMIETYKSKLISILLIGAMVVTLFICIYTYIAYKAYNLYPELFLGFVICFIYSATVGIMVSDLKIIIGNIIFKKLFSANLMIKSLRNNEIT